MNPAHTKPSKHAGTPAKKSPEREPRESEREREERGERATTFKTSPDVLKAVPPHHV